MVILNGHIHALEFSILIPYEDSHLRVVPCKHPRPVLLGVPLLSFRSSLILYGLGPVRGTPLLIPFLTGCGPIHACSDFVCGPRQVGEVFDQHPLCSRRIFWRCSATREYWLIETSLKRARRFKKTALNARRLAPEDGLC